MKNNLSQLDSYGNEILDQNKIELEPREEAELTGKLEMRIENEDETSNALYIDVSNLSIRIKSNWKK
ncbi:hypothetical protein QR98_0105640 [Sarcoptes scabiei]|uniref:Uncharacterized protein n=1 Tax=Sarcoptes scabiei TaxID=52283 RepID=A0A132ALZ4_SARSC|nr:hypothetical protein QR98_0105640 [Sarcoptes scabiei]